MPSTPELFASIASDYDRGNAICSFGLHHLWNKALVKRVGPGNRLLDLCAGTGAIAVEYQKKYPKAKLTLLDYCPEMLEIAKQKAKGSFLVANATSIPMEKRSVDVVTMAYGIRNVDDTSRCFSEVYRVLRPKGSFGILELTRPHLAPLRFLHRLYTTYCFPRLGRWIAGNEQAYRYLANSIQTFASPADLKDQLLASGLRPVEIYPLFGGIATIIICHKP